ncbi:hypothetical protein [Deinococcus peraridilitoris]|uniref:hypothetical protein n=1 Tax=Deinococcus peraridilitoris TaxID=432329 RepID=UPI0002F2E820|nr:hypothetical protein [Deinococcus peraridilitoris]
MTTERLRRFARWQLLLVSGVVGALTVTLLNESVRRVVPHAPRMDVIGERALSRTLDAAGLKPPRGKALYRWTMLGDLVSNSLYYALVGLGSPAGALPRGGALGLAAGLGAVVLPRPLGLGRQPNEQSPVTPLLTVAWYLAGGLSAAAVYRSMSRAETGNG